ncbi:MAG: hypothetical protein HYR60_03130 [Acidobacteria bacterium]|nr:hypothetical protein [Acidobacteriota bacterium]
MSKREEQAEPVEFWREQATDDRRDLRGLMIRYALSFVLVFAFVFVAFWWSGSAIHFGAARVTGDPAASYLVSGAVRDAATGEPVRWAEVADDPGGHPPFFRAQADQYGEFRLATLSLSHDIRVTANGYRMLTLRVGREWFAWWPTGSQRLDVRLVRE